MQLMLTARAYGYDTNRVGGFEVDLLAEAFDLDSERYTPVVVLALGKAEENPLKEKAHKRCCTNVYELVWLLLSRPIVTL